MMKLSAAICVDAPVSKVWEVLSQLDAIHLWSSAIHRSYCEPGHSRGVDAVRVCELGGHVTVKETIIAWDEGRSFTYVGRGLPLIKCAANTWRVEDYGPQTLVTSSAVLEVKGGIWGRLFVTILRLMSHQVGRKALVSFKYLVENGKPYEGNVKRLLPTAMTMCN